MKIEEHDGIIDIEGIDDSHAFVLYQEAFELLEWLWERRDELYRQQQHGEPAPARGEHAPFELCGCSTCTFIRSVLDGEQEPHRYI